MPAPSTFALPMLDGSPSPITRTMLAASLMLSDASGLAATPAPGDELWSYRMPGTDDFGQVLLRGEQVVEVSPASPTTLPSSVPPKLTPYSPPDPHPEMQSPE